MKFSTILAGAATALLFLMDSAMAAPTNLEARAATASNNKVIVGYVNVTSWCISTAFLN
jgi:hypothetical protein